MAGEETEDTEDELMTKLAGGDMATEAGLISNPAVPPVSAATDTAKEKKTGSKHMQIICSKFHTDDASLGVGFCITVIGNGNTKWEWFTKK